MTLEVDDRDGVQIRVFTDILRVRVCGGRYTEGENAGQPLIRITVNEEGEDRPASGLRPAPRHPVADRCSAAGERWGRVPDPLRGPGAI